MSEITSKQNEEADDSYKQREEEIIQAIFDSKNKYRKIVQAGIVKWVKDFQEGQIEIKSVDDLKKLIDIDHELLISTKRLLEQIKNPD